METTKHPMSEKANHFFKELSRVLETKMIFFGSIQRGDYFPGESDIDVDLFVENVYSTMSKLESYLRIPKTKFKKFVWKLYNGRVAYGHKVMYKQPEDKFSVEFSIYDEKFKEDVLYEHRLKIHVPFYITWLLIAWKTLHYKWHVTSRETFKKWKKIILSTFMGLPEDIFVVLDESPDATSHKIYNIVNTGFQDHFS
jgi:predicted nucleotidyltransferase